MRTFGRRPDRKYEYRVIAAWPGFQLERLYKTVRGMEMMVEDMAVSEFHGRHPTVTVERRFITRSEWGKYPMEVE